MKPDFALEIVARKKGYNLVIGVDEVGRGALAGPVVAGAVAVDTKIKKKREERRKWERVGIDDSKRLTAKKREELDKFIRKNMAWGIGGAGVAFINRYGIVKATEKAMRQAIKHVANSSWLIDHKLRATSYEPKVFVLVDAFHVKYIPGVGLENQTAIIKGDQKVLSIAAASIIAKVYRDRLMCGLAKKHRGYGWHKNMGYGTEEHLAAIRKLGMTRLHRTQFIHLPSRGEVS